MSAEGSEPASAGDTGAASAGDREPAPAAASARGRSATGRHALGVVFGLLAGAGFAGLFIALNRAGSSHDLWPIVSGQAAALVTVFVIAAAARQLRRPTRRTTMLSAVTGVTGTVGIVFYFLSTHLGLLAITAVITSLYPASTIILARSLLGERLTRLRVAGLCLAAASVALIAVSGAG